MRAGVPGGSRTKRPTVLIVDDEPDIVEYLSTVLEDNDCKPLGALDAVSAGRLLETTTPDLILLDVMMPGRSGFALYREIRRKKEMAATAVLIISGYSKAEDFSRIDFRELETEGFPPPDGFLEKPISAENLLGEIERVLAPTE